MPTTKGGSGRRIGRRTWKIRRKDKVIDLDSMSLSDFERVMRAVEFTKRHKRLERQRKRAKRKRTWKAKPGR